MFAKHRHQDYIRRMERNGNINRANGAGIASIVGSYRTFGAHGVLYEVLSVDEDKADILVVETGERTRYPLEQLMADPVAH